MMNRSALTAIAVSSITKFSYSYQGFVKRMSEKFLRGFF
jgi:hypothetical protein